MSRLTISQFIVSSFSQVPVRFQSFCERFDWAISQFE